MSRCMSMCRYIHVSLDEEVRGTGSPWSCSLGCYELPFVGARNQTWVIDLDLNLNL